MFVQNSQTQIRTSDSYPDPAVYHQKYSTVSLVPPCTYTGAVQDADGCIDNHHVKYMPIIILCISTKHIWDVLVCSQGVEEAYKTWCLHMAVLLVPLEHVFLA